MIPGEIRTDLAAPATRLSMRFAHKSGTLTAVTNWNPDMQAITAVRYLVPSADTDGADIKEPRKRRVPSMRTGRRQTCYGAPSFRFFSEPS
jgi:hypothetical protein